MIHPRGYNPPVKANPHLLGQIAVQERIVTPGQLDECLRLQQVSDPPKRLGQLLLEKGYLTAERLDALMAIQRARAETIAADPGRGGLFGQIALRLGCVTQLQLDECLREQDSLSQDGSPVLLGQLLLRKNFITTDQFLEILRRQKKEVVRCPGCDTLYDTRPHAEGSKFVCSRCGTVVQVPWRQTEPRAESPRLPGAAFQGQNVGRYQILEPVGQGGMGVVYKALHRDLNRVFALKILKSGDLTTFDTVRRFQREARLAAKLRHPNIVAVHDAGEEQGIHYIAMEYIEGEPLSARLVARRARARDNLILMEKVVRAVAYAHREGVIHRDLKPANIMVDLQGEPHIMDFGLAKQAFEGSLLTRSGAFLGTPFYMAPEQIRGEPVDARSDLYTLGVILYEILTGRLPHAGQNDAETYNRIAHEDAPPPRDLNARIHPDLQTVCLKAIEKEKDRRYPTADAFAEDLRRHLDGEPIQARPAGPVERLVRRARKNPALAVAAAASFLFLAAGGIIAAGASRSSRRFQEHIGFARQGREAGRFDVVRSEAEQALAIRPGDREARRLLDEARDRLASELKLLEEAARDAERRREARPRVDEAREMLDRLLARIPAERLGADAVSEAAAAAEKTLEEALAVAPDHEEALFHLARARLLRGDADGALRHLNEACKAREHTAAFFERGRLLLRKQRRPRGLPRQLARDDRPVFTDPAPDSPAAELYRQAARTDFSLVRAATAERWRIHFAEAALDFLELRFVEAERRLDSYLERYGSEPDALGLRALARVYQGRPDRALPDLELALRFRPGDAFLRDWRAVVRTLLGDDEGALADLTASEPGTLCIRGTLLHLRGEAARALASFQKAAELAPRWADAHAGRASALASLSRLDEAVEDLGRAIELEPREAAFHEERGLLQLRRGRKAEALADLERACELSPSRRPRLEDSLRAARGP
jgi:serine/threonine-protein kinase